MTELETATTDLQPARDPDFVDGFLPVKYLSDTDVKALCADTLSWVTVYMQKRDELAVPRAKLVLSRKATVQAEDWRMDPAYNVPDLTYTIPVGCYVTDYQATHTGRSVLTAAFHSVAPMFDLHFQTFVSQVRAGDEVEVHVKFGNDSMQMTRDGYTHDECDLHIRRRLASRKVKTFVYHFGSAIGKASDRERDRYSSLGRY